MKRAIAADSEADGPAKKTKSGTGQKPDSENGKKSKVASKPKGSAAVISSKEPTSHFKEYNLKELGLPREAWPNKKKAYAGRHGYTISARNGAVP